MWIVFQEFKGHERDVWANGSWELVGAVEEATGEDEACRRVAREPGRYAAVETRVVEVTEVPA